ncbi:class I SAM-dependent methyltransferase [Thermosynechococcus sp. HY213]|uniref:class I SAM-dependent methyltransferase n=1 Tax=Thermosynechococcus sp. HY213 TaxID=3074104 RepID=UPI002855A6CB|nr:class I SAM-dependent methyltransferase [Thermosynechococcus sp. HY213]MDR7921525.1 class I SAM-dependent methyltransferase [Thermosynechococcus sp. HY213]
MENNQESRLGRLYRQTYEALCGKHPHLRPWHFQWLDTVYLVRTLKLRLPQLTGRVLDVGCGDKPYRPLFAQATEYVGIDVAGREADYIVAPDAVFPFDDASFDVVLATQVVEHVENLPHTLGEISRVCKPGGMIVLSFPFLYNEHGSPYDFQRFTKHGAARLLPYEVHTLECQGGFGSTVVILTLNWLENSFNANKLTRLLKALTLPLWIPFCLVMNGLGLLLDQIDWTEKFYNNVFVMFRKLL